MVFIIASILLSVFSGFCKAICDLSEEGNILMNTRNNRLFWVKDFSWKNKYKLNAKKVPICIDGKLVERFWGSSRWFVFITDAWHLFGLIQRICFVITWIFVGILISQSLWYLLMLLNYAIFALSFHLFYKSKILRNGTK